MASQIQSLYHTTWLLETVFGLQRWRRKARHIHMCKVQRNTTSICLFFIRMAPQTTAPQQHSVSPMWSETKNIPMSQMQPKITLGCIFFIWMAPQTPAPQQHSVCPRCNQELPQDAYSSPEWHHTPAAHIHSVFGIRCETRNRDIPMSQMQQRITSGCIFFIWMAQETPAPQIHSMFGMRCETRGKANALSDLPKLEVVQCIRRFHETTQQQFYSHSSM